MSYERKRVVIDTSSLIAACIYPDRAPAQVFMQALQRCELVTTQETLSELIEVLGRSKFDRWRPLATRMEWLHLYAANTTQYRATERVSDCRDAKDNKFLEAALAASAEVIVSSDDDLCSLHPYRGIAILSLQDFSERYL
jgi:uncharacterized protein